MSAFKKGFVCLVLFFLVSLPAARAHGGGHVPSASLEPGQSSLSSAGMLNSETAATLGRHRILAGFRFRYTNYDQIDPWLGHTLHHQDCEIHGYQHEEDYTLDFSYGITEDLDLFLVMPAVVSKASNQIDSHPNVGNNERSTAFGYVMRTEGA